MRPRPWTPWMALGCLGLVLAGGLSGLLWLIGRVEWNWPALLEPRLPAPGEPQHALVLVIWPGVAAEELHVYERGGKPMTSLIALAVGGQIFERHVPSSEAGAAALATLLTGLPPTAHGLGSLRTPGRQRLPEAVPTLAQTLAGEGWRTLARVAPAHLAGELTGFWRGFDTWLDGTEAGVGAPAEPFEAWLAELERALGEGQSVLALLCEDHPVTSPSPRGARAAAEVRHTLAYHLQRPGVRALWNRLREAEDPDPVLDELDELLLRRRGDPAREALLAGYRRAALDVLDQRLARVQGLLDARPRIGWTMAVTGLNAAPLEELGELELASAAEQELPGSLRVPLILGGRPWRGEHHGERVAQLTCDLDLAALLSRAAEGPHDGAPVPWRSGPLPAEARSGAVVHGAELVAAAVWLEQEDAPTEGAGRLVLLGPGRTPPGEPWGGQALALAEVGGRYGRLELGSAGLEGREVVVRALGPGELLHVGEPGAGRPRVVVRLGLEADGPAVVRSARRAPSLGLRLPVGDEARVRLGPRALLELDAPLLAAPDAPPWPADREPLVALRELGGGRLGLAVRAEAGALVRVVLEALGPDPHASPQIVAPASHAVAPHPRRLAARVVEGAGPFELEVDPTRGARLALAAFVDGARVPASAIRWGERQLAGESLDLALSAWAWSDAELLGPLDAARLAAGELALSLSDPPPPGGEVHPLPERFRALVGRLGPTE